MNIEITDEERKVITRILLEELNRVNELKKYGTPFGSYRDNTYGSIKSFFDKIKFADVEYHYDD